MRLETPAQAARFNRRLVNACLRAQTQPEPVRPGQLHVAIIGAGATGTELAAELHRTLREVIAHGLDRIDPERDIRIVLIEAADRLLPALPERISKATRRLLERMGVEVKTSARVKEVTSEGVQLADGSFIPAELVVWAAGVKAPEVLRNMDGLETNRLNQLVVEPTLQTTLDANIFAPWRLRRLPPARRYGFRAAARTGRAPAGRPPAGADRKPPPRPDAATFRLSGFRLAGVARPSQHRRQPDGRDLRPRRFY